MSVFPEEAAYTARVLIPLLAAWLLALIFGKPMVPFLHRIKFSQTEREEGLESHKKKTGTPTMGGIIFLVPMAAVTLASMIFGHENPGDLLAVLIPTVGFGLIGFADDYLKVVRKKNLGLRAWQKLALQFVITVLFAVFLHYFTEVSLEEMLVPFMPGTVLKLGIFAVPALIFIALATTNGTNFTDGVDGLCASVTAVVAVFFAFAAALSGGPGAAAAAAMTGALLGYLYYNLYPAKVFMGDTGSLAIGGFVTGMAYVLRMPLFIPIIGLIYAAEVISVVLQVTYFKATHGKRIFRMAPIHHHYEKGGWSETKVVGVFTTVTIIMCLIAMAGLS